LVSGLAVGFLIGNEYGRRSDGKSASSDKASDTTQTATATGPTEIPADWLKEGDIGIADKVAGLTPQQKYLVLKVLNEKPCDCGCPHGSFAKCKKEDPGCPRAPLVAQQAADAAKAGKTFDQIVEAVKKPAGAAAQQQPNNAPQKIELAAWTPIKGPKYAKVTILEFSDFQ
jgi:hypothetical protein